MALRYFQPGGLLDSIQNQTFKDYEIIVADADSKDNTRKIAKEFGCRIVEGGLPALFALTGRRIRRLPIDPEALKT